MLMGLIIKNKVVYIFVLINHFILQVKKFKVNLIINLGNIYLNVGGGAFPSSTIYLKVKGSEKAKWSETKTVWEDVPGTNPP